MTMNVCLMCMRNVLKPNSTEGPVTAVIVGIRFRILTALQLKYIAMKLNVLRFCMDDENTTESVNMYCPCQSNVNVYNNVI